MGVLQSLGDMFASGFTGQNTQDVIDKSDMMRAQMEDVQAQVPLRGAQTQKALADADAARSAATKAAKAQEAQDRIREGSADPNYKPSLGDLMDAAGGNYDQVTAGMGHAQEQGFRSTLADPNADPSLRLAAQAGVKGEVPNPYVALPNNAIDLRNLAPPGAKPNEILSQTGAATVSQKLSVADLNQAKLLAAKADSGSLSAMTPDEIWFLAHATNSGAPAPAFGMGKNEDRRLFLKARAQDAAGQSVTYESLGMKPPAGGAAPSAAGKLSPTVAADAMVGHTTDVKAAQTAINKTTQMLTMMNSQEVTAMRNYDLALGLAEKLGRENGSLLNKALNDWKTGVQSDPATTAFVSALQTAHDEIAKIRSGAVSAQGITDAGRKAADSIVSPNMNLSTLRALRPVISTDIQNVRKGYQTSIGAARSVIANPSGGGIAGPAGEAAAAAATDELPPAAAATLKAGKITHFGNGQKWTLQDGKPVQVP